MTPETPAGPVVDAATIFDILRWRALNQPEKRAYTFLVDGELAVAHLSYAELDLRARAIGARLQRLGAQGERVLLLFPPGLEYIAAFFGCVYAGAVAVPAYPPHPTRVDRTSFRLRVIARDARPLVALTTSSILALVETLYAQEADFQAMNWLAADQLTNAAAERWQPPTTTRDTLAFLQYTSGSTAAPKGVMLTHRNLLANAAYISEAEKHISQRLGMFWLPPYHDLGLIGGILQPLYYGDTSLLMSPVSFLQQPIRWLRAIARYGATHSAAPNFAYDLCVRKIGPDQRATLDLSSWQIAYNGAEPIRAETINRFVAAFGPCGFCASAFMPCYGLAEATLMVSSAPGATEPVETTVDANALEQRRVVAAAPDAPTARTLVSSGRTMLDTQVRIVQPDTATLCPPDEVGEIWVAGPTVAQGYWQRPRESEQLFHAHLADSGAGPFLRTGDLGFVQDGELFVTGRLKDLIIIGGRNIYPEDLERTAEQSHPLLRPSCCAAFSVEVDGEERVIIAQEVERRYRDTDADEVRRAIRRAVMEQNDVRLYAVLLLRAGRIPKTSSGKIQRHACHDSYLAGNLDVVKE
jgi:acyl-CoA synthetase (AMP-forming)/AMP-acid ligase II